MGITYEGATEQVRQIVHHYAMLRRGVERRAGTLCEAAENGVPFQRQMAILRGYLERALPGTVTAGVPAPWHDGWPDGCGTSRSTERSRVSTGCTITWRRDDRPDCQATSRGSVGLAG